MKEREAKVLRDRIVKECQVPIAKVRLERAWDSQYWDYSVEVMLPSGKMVLISQEYEYQTWKKGILEEMEIAKKGSS